MYKSKSLTGSQVREIAGDASFEHFTLSTYGRGVSLDSGVYGVVGVLQSCFCPCAPDYDTFVVQDVSRFIAFCKKNGFGVYHTGQHRFIV